MISDYIGQLDSFAVDVAFEAKAFVSTLERLAGQLHDIESASQRIRYAPEANQEAAQMTINDASEMNMVLIEELPELIMSCEMESEDLLKILTQYIPQVFDGLRRNINSVRNDK